MQVRALTFEQYHNKSGIGSTRLRIHQLIKHWPEFKIYRYGENPDVLIFQKVYMSYDYKFHAQFEGITILDICDPDWMDNLAVKETCDAVDGITVPTQALADYLAQITTTPILVIPDRHEIPALPPKHHVGQAKSVVWFGYKQNAELLQHALPTLERLGLKLTVIANEDPMPYRWADDGEAYRELYSFVRHDAETLIADLQQHDICVLPAGTRPVDRFKSNNKTTLAWLAGLPVAVDGDELRRFLDPAERQTEADEKYALAVEQYDVKLSVIELKQFIEVLSGNRLSNMMSSLV